MLRYIVTTENVKLADPETDGDTSTVLDNRDNANILLWTSVMFMSAAALVAVLTELKKE